MKLIVGPHVLLTIALTIGTIGCDSGGEPTGTPDPEVMLGSGIVPTEDKALRRDAGVYASDQGIDIDEALQRFKLMEDAGPLGAVLESKEKETFAGLWIEHDPEFRVIVAFTENGEETIKKYVEEGSALAGIIELRTFESSLDQLRTAQQETGELLDVLGLYLASVIAVSENRVEVYVTDGQLFDEMLRKAGAKLPDHVVPITTYEPLRDIPFALNPDPSVCFPQLRMHSGGSMDALLTGELVLEDCYLRVGGELIIWQPDFFVNNNDGVIEILDREGNVAAWVGQTVNVGGGEIESIERVNKLIKEPLPGDCQGPYWLMGNIAPAVR